MKKHSVLAGFGLAMLALSTQAQGITSDLPSTKKSRSFESTTTWRLGQQGVSLGGLNTALEQTGYRALPNQFTMVGVATQVGHKESPWIMISQFDFGLNSTKQSVTNGTNTVKTSLWQYGVGAGYHIVHTDKFTLTPRLMLSPGFFSLRVTRNDAPTPSLTAVLINPGSQQTATFTSGTITGDLGLSGQYQFVYKSTTSQSTTDCGTVSETRQRLLVVGFDAGYRLSPNTRFRQPMNDQAVTNSDNPAINLSGWYVTARLGFGRRYIR
ncbi:MAG: hypothetical protein H7319_06190 [Spirosoma sp.]|nr:hypothetical protein [Spirosoma sp.]